MADTILVTGGAGYIGSHACKALAAAGWRPIAFDNLATGWADAVRYGPFEQGSLLDRDRLDAVFAAHAPVAILHFAAASDVGESVRDPAKYWRNNLLGSLTLVEAALAHGCDHLVFSSTCAVYGEADGMALDETTPIAPINAYGASKGAVEEMLGHMGWAHGLNSVIFRYFNVAGADPDAEIGEFHRPETHLVPLVLDAIVGRRRALTVHGTDYPTRDGTAVRDYVHVTDLVDAHLLGLDALLSGTAAATVYNLGTGHGFSVREVIETARDVTGRRVPSTDGPRRAGDAVALVADSARARRVLGWRPARSTMETMIADAWRWHRTGSYAR